MFSRYLLVWLLLAVVAVVNGIVRQSTYGKSMSDLAAHQVSTLTAIVATGVVVWLVHRAWPLESASQAIAVGGAWLVMTVLFEFSFGHFVAGHPWSRLLADYNLFEGRVWSLFLAWLVLMPWLFHRLSAHGT